MGMRARAGAVLVAATFGVSACSGLGGSSNPTFVPTDEPATSTSADPSATTTQATAQPTAQDLFVMPEGSQWLESGSVPVRFAIPSNWAVVDNLAISRGQAEIPQQYAELLTEQKKTPAHEIAAQLKNGILINAISLGGDDEGANLAITYNQAQQSVTQADLQRLLTALQATAPKIAQTQTPLGPALTATFTRKVSASLAATGQLLAAKTAHGVVVFLLVAPDAKTTQSVMSLLAKSLSAPL